MSSIITQITIEGYNMCNSDRTKWVILSICQQAYRKIPLHFILYTSKGRAITLQSLYIGSQILLPCFYPIMIFCFFNYCAAYLILALRRKYKHAFVLRIVCIISKAISQIILVNNYGKGPLVLILGNSEKQYFISFNI
jgi:hypothetical protein